MKQLLPEWQRAVPIESPDMDLHDMQGATGLVRYMDDRDDDDDGEDTGDCCEDLGVCLSEKNALDQENKDLTTENQELTEENEELTDIANGTPSGCASILTKRDFGISPWYTSGTVCMSGTAGALVATWSSTFVSWPDPGGPGAGTTSIRGYFIDETHTKIGSDVFALNYGFRWEKNEGQATPFTVTGTATRGIPSTAIGMEWTDLGILRGTTYLS